LRTQEVGEITNTTRQGVARNSQWGEF